MLNLEHPSLFPVEKKILNCLILYWYQNMSKIWLLERFFKCSRRNKKYFKWNSGWKTFFRCIIIRQSFLIKVVDLLKNSWFADILKTLLIVAILTLEETCHVTPRFPLCSLLSIGTKMTVISTNLFVFLMWKRMV